MDSNTPTVEWGRPFFPKTLFSNQELLKTNTTSWWKIVLLLVVNISLIAAPFFMARVQTKAEDVFFYMPGLEEALELLYRQEVPCQITDGQMTCLSVGGTSRDFGDYRVYFLPEDSADIPTDRSRIVFRKTDVVFDYVAPDPVDNYTLTGTLRLLETMDFAQINRTDLQWEHLTEPEFYAMVNETFVQSLLNSTLPGYFAMIYLTQFVQTILYALLMSVLLMAANFRRPTRRLRYGSSLRYVVVGITGPALLAAVVGLINTTIGTILWSAVYAVRMILLYSTINKFKGTL